MYMYARYMYMYQPFDIFDFFFSLKISHFFFFLFFIAFFSLYFLELLPEEVGVAEGDDIMITSLSLFFSVSLITMNSVSKNNRNKNHMKLM